MKSLTLLRVLCFVVAVPIFFVRAHGQVVPGTGIHQTRVGDDFEDEAWQWFPNGQKASREQDEQERRPLGGSNNSRWFESPKRGMPDVIERVATPEGGIAGSKGALKLQTFHTGVPGRPNRKMEQDDFIMACASRIGGVDVSRSPNVTCRIWLPPYQNWEDRSGSHFGYRIDVKTTVTFEFHSETDPRYEEDEAVLLIRGNNLGQEVKSVQLSPGWWTFGMSVTPDGRVHYYAHAGVNDLSASDHLYSSFPYGYTAEIFATQFFNSVNMNDGRTFSTPFIIDDPAFFTLR
jgi:hypothetical protein